MGVRPSRGPAAETAFPRAWWSTRRRASASKRLAANPESRGTQHPRTGGPVTAAWLRLMPAVAWVRPRSAGRRRLGRHSPWHAHGHDHHTGAWVEIFSRTGVGAAESCSTTSGRSRPTTGTTQLCSFVSSSRTATGWSSMNRRGHRPLLARRRRTHMEHYADDLAAVTPPDPQEAIHVSHSSTAAARSCATSPRHREDTASRSRADQLQCPPLMVQTEANWRVAEERVSKTISRLSLHEPAVF